MGAATEKDLSAKVTSIFPLGGSNMGWYIAIVSAVHHLTKNFRRF